MLSNSVAHKTKLVNMQTSFSSPLFNYRKEQKIWYRVSNDYRNMHIG